MSLKDTESHIIQEGENEEILELLIEKKHIGLFVYNFINGVSSLRQACHIFGTEQGSVMDN